MVKSGPREGGLRSPGGPWEGGRLPPAFYIETCWQWSGGQNEVLGRVKKWSKWVLEDGPNRPPPYGWGGGTKSHGRPSSIGRRVSIEGVVKPSGKWSKPMVLRGMGGGQGVKGSLSQSQPL